MKTEKSSTLTLRIFSNTLTCSDISRFLEWEATERFEKGDLFGGRENKKPREEALWKYEINLEEYMLFEEKLTALVDIILKKNENFKRIAGKCNIDIFCSYTTYNGQGGFALDAQLMKKLSDLNIDFIIDFFA